MASIFTRIINGEIPCYKIAETEQFFAFLDINPVQKGHCLVIPKKEVDYIFDLDEKEYLHLQQYARYIATGLRQAVECRRIAATVVGLEVPHVHIHLVPLQNLPFINFAAERQSLSKDEMEQIAADIRRELAKLPLPKFV